MLILDPERYDVRMGEADYAVELGGGDRQVDYSILCDCECAVYIGAGKDKGIPIAVGTNVRGRVLVKEAQWLLVKPAKRTAVVAIQVMACERRIQDPVDGKPLAVFVPELPPINLMDHMRRLVGQKAEEEDIYIQMDEEDLFPDDIDAEFGSGSMQFEEDDEIAEVIENEIRARREAAEAGKRGTDRREEDTEGDPEEPGPAPRRRAKKKKPAEEAPADGE